jgi:hypothetical protein
MIRRILTVCAALAASASIAGAQQRQLPAELGVDAGISIGFDKPQVTTTSIPVPAIRLGFYINDRVSIEPKAGLQTFHDNTGSSTTYHAEVGVLLHFENDPVGRGLYARPFLGLVGVTGIGAGSGQARTLYGGGLGLKAPFANRFASRLEVNYSHTTAPPGSPALNNLGILVGISVFSR